MIGKTLGHYQITNQLGKGGMGEVFQAKDQKLCRLAYWEIASQLRTRLSITGGENGESRYSV